MSENLEDLEKQAEEFKNSQQGQVASVKNIFNKPKEVQVVEKQDPKNELVENMFDEAIRHEVANNEDLQSDMLGTAKVYVGTKMQTIKTNVDTEYKAANFNNKKDACESYGFNEKTTPIWATNFMTFGYNIMLAIWLFIGSFTFMPVIFIAKKMSVGLKKTWVAVIFSLILYLGITFVPILLALLGK